MTAALRRSFDSLSVPNYRRYFWGQIVSLSGNWMQTVAEIWLILSLTNSGIAVGMTTALQFLPMLLFGAWGGLLADRFSKRRLLIVTQALMAIPALFLFGVTVAGVVTPAMVFATVFARGAVNAVDNPTRQSFAIEMVGADRLVNAVSLNSVLIQVARIAGPGIAGILIATIGVAPCFAINAATFLAMIFALRGMEAGALDSAPRPPARARCRAGRASPCRRDAAPRCPAGADGPGGDAWLQLHHGPSASGKFTFGGGAMVYAALLSAMAVGSVAGALATGARARADASVIATAAFAFGLLALLAAGVPQLWMELPVLALLGAATVTFAASTNSYLQLEVRPDMRGRVMALYSIVFLGSTPIGGPLTGWLSEQYDPRVALVLAGLSGLCAAWVARRVLGRIERDGMGRAQAAALEVDTSEHALAA